MILKEFLYFLTIAWLHISYGLEFNFWIEMPISGILYGLALFCDRIKLTRDFERRWLIYNENSNSAKN